MAIRILCYLIYPCYPPSPPLACLSTCSTYIHLANHNIYISFVIKYIPGETNPGLLALSYCSICYFQIMPTHQPRTTTSHGGTAERSFLQRAEPGSHCNGGRIILSFKPCSQSLIVTYDLLFRKSANEK